MGGCSLHQRAGLDHLTDAFEEVGAGVPLGMCDQDVKAAVVEPLDEFDDVVVERARPRLDQQPAPSDAH